ncbi:MAG: phytoene desaturase [Erythrobacter sp.]|nr:phytoene desaturase [Erythrobacter sp.]
MVLDPARYAGRSACVIGAGLGGLALAIRLQSAGIATTIIEARQTPGGFAHSHESDGFTFDAGPAIVTEPAGLEELWALSGHEMARDVELVPVVPLYRLNWPDGANFEYSGDPQALTAEIARINPADVAGFDRLVEYSDGIYRDGYRRLAQTPLPDFRAMLKSVPALARMRAWQSVYASVARYIGNERLRQALSFHTLMAGGNPMTTSVANAPLLDPARHGGAWWARGGTGRLVAGMVRHFERLGGAVRLGDPVIRIHTMGTHACEVVTQGGWMQRFDAVASNADVVHTYRDLLGQTKHGKDQARRLMRKRFGPSLFVVHFALEGKWPGIPHRMVLFGPRYRGLLNDIFNLGVLPRDMMIFLDHPTVTDPSLAPAGKSVFRAVVPVAHMGKLAVDWDQIGPMLEKRVLDEIGRRLIPDIHDRIVTRFHYTPRDFALDLNAHLGSAFGLEPLPWQSGWLRTHNRDDVIDNLYFVGAGTHPGAGFPGVVAGAKVTAGLMLKDLIVERRV